MILTTDRLVLRPHCATDHAACAALWRSEKVTQFIGGRSQSAQEAWFRVLRYAGSWTLLGYGFWAIFDRGTGEFVGEGGFSDFRRGIVELVGAPEIGWAFVPAAWGRGLASESVGAMVTWADVHLEVPETRCMISAGNIGSVKVATRNDYVECATLPDGARVFSRPRQQF